VNHRLEQQLDRLAKVTEIADLFRERRITRDSFELPGPRAPGADTHAEVWGHIDRLLADLMGARKTPGAEEVAEELEKQLAEALDVARASTLQVDPDWVADVRTRLIAAEQAIAFLDEQTRELDLLRREKDSIVDGAARLEQNIDDLWKSLNEKTTHIQRLEAQLQRIWNSPPYRAFDWLRALVRRKGRK
jgi:DNA gyrase/topoisomerase IV subunit A